MTTERRSRFTEGELIIAKRILAYLAVKPGPCICGNISYIYGIYSGSGVYAKCMKCGYRRRYIVSNLNWGPLYLDFEDRSTDFE